MVFRVAVTDFPQVAEILHKGVIMGKNEHSFQRKQRSSIKKTSDPWEGSQLMEYILKLEFKSNISSRPVNNKTCPPYIRFFKNQIIHCMGMEPSMHHVQI